MGALRLLTGLALASAVEGASAAGATDAAMAKSSAGKRSRRTRRIIGTMADKDAPEQVMFIVRRPSISLAAAEQVLNPIVHGRRGQVLTIRRRPPEAG